MKHLFVFSNLLYEITILLSAYIQLNEIDSWKAGVVFLALLLSLFASSVPVSFYREIGFGISKIKCDIDTICKIAEVFYIIVAIPILMTYSVKSFVFIPLIVIIMSNTVNRALLYVDMKTEGIDIYSVHKKIEDYDNENKEAVKEHDELIKKAWATLIPAFVFGIAQQSTYLFFIVVCVVYIAAEIHFIKNFYVEVSRVKPILKESFKRPCYKAILYTIALIVMGYFRPDFFFIFTGLLTAEFVEWTHFNFLPKKTDAKKGSY